MLEDELENSKINAASLTGMIDIVMVKQPDGSILSSPLRVRIGKSRAFLPLTKILNIRINGEETGLEMRLDQEGQAYLVDEASDDRRIELTTDELSSIQPLLKHGKNDVEVTVLGKERKAVNASIYFWNYDQKLVISDIDGTVTRSDVLGHVVPRFSKSNWSHSGIAALYSKIQQNGYDILYLTSRNIGLMNDTRKYLQ